MATMGSYCKAYPVQRLREFAGWKENTQNLRKERSGKADEQTIAPEELTGNDHLYLQENFFVTDSISLDENIIFDAVTPEWIDFCQNRLKFQLPVYEPVPGQAPQREAGANTATPTLDAEPLH